MHLLFCKSKKVIKIVWITVIWLSMSHYVVFWNSYLADYSQIAATCYHLLLSLPKNCSPNWKLVTSVLDILTWVISITMEILYKDNRRPSNQRIAFLSRESNVSSSFTFKFLGRTCWKLPMNFILLFSACYLIFHKK